MIVETGIFKGKPVITFKRTPDDKFPFTMGVRKCQTVIAHIDEIQNFYETHKQTIARPAEPNE